MRKFFDLKVYGCEAHYEIDGYIKEVTGKNMNSLDKKEMQKIFNKVESCLPKQEVKVASEQEESEESQQEESEQQEETVQQESSQQEESVKQESVKE